MPGQPTLVVLHRRRALFFLMLCGIKTFVNATFIATLIGFARASLVFSDNRRKFMRTEDEKLELEPYLLIK